MFRILKPALRVGKHIVNSPRTKLHRLVNMFGTVGKDSNIGSKDKGQTIVPDNFFDDDIENEKEYLDILSTLQERGGLERITSIARTTTLDEFQADAERSLCTPENVNDVRDGHVSQIDLQDSDLIDPSSSQGLLENSLSDHVLDDHIQSFGSGHDKVVLPVEMLNYSHPWRKTVDYPDEKLNKFVTNTDPEKFRFDQQGNRACPGKRQRQNLSPGLRCHLIDLDELSYLDVATMRRFLSDDSEILGRKSTGLCSKCQRKVAKAVKRARNFAIVPHLGEFVIRDGRPLNRNTTFHDVVEGQTHVASKTIL